jgi:SAM-dependent methyltransferase
MGSIQASYARHALELENAKLNVPVVIGDPDSIDALNHEQQFSGVDALVRAWPTANWLTIGDSGADVHLLYKAGAQDITATNISDVALRFLTTTGKLPPCQIRSLNAEDIGRPNESIDFVLCRQAFHHFPRPMIGFYEMWRVARVGVVLIEPADILPVRIFERARTLAKRVLRGQRGDETLFEADAANFIYRLSLNEAWKAAVALQATSMFQRQFNHMYLQKVSAAKRTDPLMRFAYGTAIGLQNALCATGLMSWGMGGVILLKATPTKDLSNQLQTCGWRSRPVPRNPYIAQTSAPAGSA